MFLCDRNSAASPLSRGFYGANPCVVMPSKTELGHEITSQSKTTAPGTASWIAEPTGFSTPKSISANDNPS